MTATRRTPLALFALYAATWATSVPFAATDRLVLSALIALPLVWLTLADLDRQEIPDLATATIALAGAVFQWHLHGPTLSFLIELGLAAGLTAAFWYAGHRHFARHGTEALGIGDAKLIGAGALCVGAGAIWAVLFVAATGGIVAALLSRRRDPVTVGLAFGPFLAYGIFIFVNFSVSGPAAP